MTSRDLNRIQPVRPVRLQVWPVLALALMAAGPTAQAQSADATRGRLLYEQTPDVTGVNSLQNCRDCHNNSSRNIELDAVVERRRQIGGTEFAAITPSQARTRITGTGLNRPEMAPYRGTLSAQDLDDLAAYIADTPKTSAAAMEFAAPAVQGTALAFFDLTHSVATAFPLVVTRVAVTGVGAASFVAAGCEGQTLNAGNACRVQVQFTAPDTERKNAQVLLSLTQQGVTFSRTVALTGGVAGVTPPAGDGGLNASGNSGGGSISFGWLLALGAAALAARRLRGRLSEVEATRAARDAAPPRRAPGAARQGRHGGGLQSAARPASRQS